MNKTINIKGEIQNQIHKRKTTNAKTKAEQRNTKNTP